MTFAFGIGIGTQNSKGDWLEVYFHQPVLQPSAALEKAARSVVGVTEGSVVARLAATQLNALAGHLAQANEEAQAELARRASQSTSPVVLVLIEADGKPSSTPEAYLKLHLLSHRLVKPHGVVLESIFALLPNVAWTSEGAIDLTELPERRLAARLAGRVLDVQSVDKFPPMTQYIVPTGVRIADAARVRLGAHVGEGTTVMHEGFINFNAGTEGKSMVEGRISAGVMVGEGSDLGGGCSTMGTLSGGGNMVISIGKSSLLGANSGVGIPLGDRCIIEAGLYITAGTKVAILDEKNALVKQVKARDLAGMNDLLFRRNSETGRVECKTNKTAIELNEALHANN